MTCSDHDRVNRRIRIKFLLVSSAEFKSELLRSRVCASSAGCAQSNKLCASQLPDSGNQCSLREVPRAQQAHSDRGLIRPAELPWNNLHALCRLIFLVRVADQHSKVRLLRFARDYLISGGCVFNVEGMRDQRLQIQLAVGKQLQKRVHISRLAPAHVANGIITSFLLESLVVSAGSVRA